jgi:hypothetical protein
MVNLRFRKKLYCSVAAFLSLFALCGNNLYAADNSGSSGVSIAANGDYAIIESMETQAGTQVGALSGTWVLNGVEVYKYSANGDSSKIASGDLPTNCITGAFSTLKFNDDNCSVRVVDNLTKREMDETGAFVVSDNRFTLYVTTMPFDYTIVSEENNTMILYHKYSHSDILYGIKLNYKK